MAHATFLLNGGARLPGANGLAHLGGLFQKLPRLSQLYPWEWYGRRSTELSTKPVDGSAVPEEGLTWHHPSTPSEMHPNEKALLSSGNGRRTHTRPRLARPPSQCVTAEGMVCCWKDSGRGGQLREGLGAWQWAQPSSLQAFWQGHFYDRGWGGSCRTSRPPLTQLNGQCQLGRERRAETAAPVTSWVEVRMEATDGGGEGPLDPRPQGRDEDCGSGWLG